MAPDHPMFIKNESSDYNSDWHNFIRRKADASFYISPLPKYSSDIVISKKRLKRLIDHSMKTCKNEFEIGSRVIYSKAHL